MKPEDVTRSSEPKTELAEIGELLLNARGDEEVKAIVMLRKGTEWAVAVGGYDTEDTAGMVADALVHVRAMLKTIGKELHIVDPKEARRLQLIPKIGGDA